MTACYKSDKIMDWSEKIMFEIWSEQGIEPKIAKEYECGWELITMSFTGDKHEDGYREVALVFKYVG